jgi:hypothetical protein
VRPRGWNGSVKRRPRRGIWRAERNDRDAREAYPGQSVVRTRRCQQGRTTGSAPSALRSTAAFQARLGSLPPPPESFFAGDDLNWDAPWIEVTLRVELPFWLMVDDAAIPIQVGSHTFPVSLHGEWFELHICIVSDSKQSAVAQAPSLLSPSAPSGSPEDSPRHVAGRICLLPVHQEVSGLPRE